MNTRKIVAGLALALSLHAASALAVGSGREAASRTHTVPGSPRAAAVHPGEKNGARTQKGRAIKRTHPRERSTDLELPQLG